MLDKIIGLNLRMNMEKQERYRNIRRKPKEKRVEFETES
jgi:hypothetical protein